MDLSSFSVEGLDTAYYIPDFVSEDEEAYLIRKAIESPQQRWKNMQNRRLQTWGGELLAKSRLLPRPMPPYMTDFPNLIGRIQDTGAFAMSPHRKPNHVILNEYHPGQGIMPHEDGPSYHPVVATLSLGSHAVFHYYRYRDEGDSALTRENLAPMTSVQGHAVDPTPVASVLLEPRSLVITTNDLYARHLHGIAEIEEDVFNAPGDAPDTIPAPIRNTKLLGDGATRDVVLQGGKLIRNVRYSLTCRDVERVASAAGLAIGKR
ncbi:hypothetical protein PHLGIDRAFT_71993 [Phlebiopsis gigantea 11061_1 CR5-6]|uniref:Fe2OG dioxygenase domain-containing protein n=1 Tax=Phlebiopsis gigantea (strain 11061_1 CR5-6) TaxID=745531 RepID=A0A0C3NP46_PHLG1|nr:hypothetical protein PHLGIDRAFT_71993 [Phlebiopsis gigantea 11061_1 CR5-6]